MLEIYRFPKNYLPFWHIGARASTGAFRQFLNQMRREGKSRILDVGAGGGWQSLYAASLDFPVMAFDVSEANIGHLSDLARLMGVDENLATITGNGNRLPFDDDSYDIILSSHVIEHVDTPREMLGEIARVLKPGGVLRLSCPSLNQRMRISKWLGLNLDPEDHKVIGYGKEQLKRMIPESLKIEKVTYQGRFVEANVLDLTSLLSRLTGIKANPLQHKDLERQKSAMRESPMMTAAFFLKEACLLPVIGISKIENNLLSSVKGSMITFEIRKA